MSEDATDVKLSTDVEVTSSSPDDSRLSKTWGTITAFPHEYLVHFRRGKFNEETSGQGASCFKRPSDTVFIIPTSLKEIVFQANQLSVDNVDVRIRGMAIYRIHDPLKIYSMLNFANRQRAEEKLARMIGDLCRSTAKWLVANMGIEECLRKRKEDIAESLKKEISLVVSDEKTGWGVEIVTIDIQDVYIQDKQIFDAMQNLFKVSKLRESELSQLEMEKDLEVRRLQQSLELAEHRKNSELENARIAAEVEQEKLRLSQENDERQFKLDRSRVEQKEETSNYKQDQMLSRQRQIVELEADKVRAHQEAERLKSEIELDALQKRVDIENSATPLSLERNFIDTALPAMAEALAKSMNNARVNIVQGEGAGGTPFRFILDEMMDIMRERIERLPKSE